MSEQPSNTPTDLSFWLWILVLILLIGNLSFLLIFNVDAGSKAVVGDQKSVAGSRWSVAELLWGPDDEQPTLSKFDGLPIDPETQESVISVMVDNLSVARAQHSGIRQASIVYEAMAEGGITRLMLLFPYQETERVGPVRSARDYFVGFAEEYGGIYAHAGGSPAALEKLYSSAKLRDLDEDDGLGEETYSTRDLRYYAPHNLFFDLLLVRIRAEELGWKISPSDSAWCFSDTALITEHSVASLDLDFANSPDFESYVQFRYDPEERHYLRYYGHQDPSPHIDQLDKLQVAPRNIIVQVAPSALINGDEKERIAVQTTGSGKAILYRDGKKSEGRWEKSSGDSATSYLDASGKPFCLSPGQTWIAIVDSEELIHENNQLKPR